MSENLDKKFALALERLEEMKLQREAKKASRIKVKVPKKKRSKGRPRINPQTIEMAKEMAKTKPLPIVSFILNISKTTLYNYGIKAGKRNKLIK